MSVLEIMERLLKLENAVIHLDKKIQERDKSCILLEFWIRQKFDYDAQAVSQLMEEEVKRNHNNENSLNGNNNTNTAQETDNQATRNGYEHLLSVLQAPSKSQAIESLNHLRAFSFTTNVHDQNRNAPNNNNDNNDDDDDTNGINVVDHEGKSIDPFDSGVGDNFPLSMEQDYNCDELGMDTKGTKNLDIYDYDESSHGTNISTSTLTTTNSNNNNLASDKIDFGSYFEAESRRGNNSTGTPSKTRTRKSKNDPNSGVNCKYCKKDFAKTYIFRHQKKCKWKLAAVAKEEDVVQQPMESVSQPAEDQKTDPFISAVVMCHGGGENIVSDCGNTNSSASTPVMPMDENSADEEKSSATEPKLRFSCKVCSQSFLTLRACRQHIVTEHITHVLNTPLIPSDATFRIMGNNSMPTNINGGLQIPTSSSGLNFNTNLAGPIQNLTNLTLLGLSSSSPGNVMTMSSPLLQSELRGGGGGGASKSNSNSKDVILKQLFQHPVLRVKDKNSVDLSNNSLFQEKKGKSRGSITPTSTVTTPTTTNENEDVTTNLNPSTTSNNTSNGNNNQQSKSQGFTYPCLHCKNVNISKNFQNLQDLHLHVLQCHVIKKVKFRCPLCYQEFAEQDVFAEHIIKVHRQGIPLLQNENVSTSSFVNDESRLNQSYSLPVFNIRGGDSNQSLNLSAILNSTNNLQQQPQSLVVDFQNDTISNGQSQSLTSTQLQQPLFKCGACSFTFQDFSTAEDHARECHFSSQDLVESRALESSPINHSNSSSNSNNDNQSVAIDLIRSTFGDNIFMCPGP